jgi:hypothetical protein
VAFLGAVGSAHVNVGAVYHVSLGQPWGFRRTRGFGPLSRLWRRSLARRRAAVVAATRLLLQVMEDSAILKTDRQREGYKLVRTQLKQEFEFERLTWPLDE